ncbi:MAG: FtsW/RodA/SpoVE family cell cycle protein [Zetaproteobacteria bacterium]|nr:MAG: FtsW/RodA/SpoVE family cell cycle protein [Zetaproteobacteria bacterium]
MGWRMRSPAPPRCSPPFPWCWRRRRPASTSMPTMPRAERHSSARWSSSDEGGGRSGHGRAQRLPGADGRDVARPHADPARFRSCDDLQRQLGGGRHPLRRSLADRTPLALLPAARAAHHLGGVAHRSLLDPGGDAGLADAGGPRLDDAGADPRRRHPAQRRPALVFLRRPHPAAGGAGQGGGGALHGLLPGRLSRAAFLAAQRVGADAGGADRLRRPAAASARLRQRDAHRRGLGRHVVPRRGAAALHGRHGGVGDPLCGGGHRLRPLPGQALPQLHRSVGRPLRQRLPAGPVDPRLRLRRGGRRRPGSGGAEALLPAGVVHRLHRAAVIGEELGLVGTLSLILLFALLIARCYRIAMKSRVLYERLVVLGCTMMLAFTFMINLGASSGLMPTKGMPMPFVSYGGSALLGDCLLMGLIFSVQRHLPENSRQKVSAPKRRIPVVA